MEQYFRSLIIVVAIITGVSEVHSSLLTSEVFSLIRDVIDRILQDSSQPHDILCVECSGNVFDDAIVRLQVARPYLVFTHEKNISLAVKFHDNFSGKKRENSMVIQVCLQGLQCGWGQMLLFQNPNKYAIFVQLFHGVAHTQIIQLANELVNYGILKVLQFVASPVDDGQASIYISSSITRQWNHVGNNSNAVDILFGKRLTSFKGYMYEVGYVPIMVNTYMKNKEFHSLDIEFFKIILRRQGARFRFHPENLLQPLISKLITGQIDVLLNPVEMNGNYFEKAYWNNNRQFCVVLPRRYERMHLQLLLTPFKWHIWLVIVLILLAVQLSNLLCPRYIPRLLILRCFFGGGSPEHTLPLVSRLTVCAICVLIFLLSETYQAILLSLMSADPFEKNPETIEEFIALNQTIILLKNEFIQFPKILQKLIASREIIYIDTLLHNATVLNCDTAYYMNSNLAYVHLASKLDLVVLKPPIYWKLHWIAFSWMSPAAREFQRYMHILFDVGVYQKVHQSWFPKRIYKKRDQTFNDLIVLTEDLVPVWELLGTGLFIAFLAFLAEWITYAVTIFAYKK
ncbi:uncharacterized protein LOC131293653 [Anopheles ziemanni]|uniref:uncharacterized protein LOC131264448 n=1 Tax=Anopheles coustani TaxID=139045 RepID=UPI002659C287|nr:uncharacterized protein LOC131264448 [Anopheles coustani]XP_058177711.1 uncharacterized protein LOC131293653 [Anopheles ziemanni]